MTRMFTLLVSAALVVTASACTANAAPLDSSGTTTTSTASVEAGSAQSATLESTPPRPTAAASTYTQPSEITVSSTTDGTAASPLAGFNLAGEELAKAEAAWEAYGRYEALYKQAVKNPGADWTAQLANLTADPLIVNAQTALTRQAQLGQVVDSRLNVEITGVSVFPLYVLFNGCFDNTNTTIVDKDGKDVKAPDAPGSYYRMPGEIEIDLVDGEWRTVVISVPDRNVSC